MKKDISIIIATYNAAKTLSNALDSIAIQKVPSVELLIIDGASTDGTIDIIKDYQEKNIVDFFISEPDKGVYDAWNKGIKESTGEWIMFLGADDTLQPNAIQIYLNFIHGNNCDLLEIISAKLVSINKNETHLGYVGEPWNWKKMCKRKLSFAHPGLLHRRILFDSFGSFDLKYKICADSDFFQRIGPKVKAGFIDEVTVKMKQGGMSDSYAALREGFLSRKNNKVISLPLNVFMHIKIFVIYTLLRIKRFIINK